MSLIPASAFLDKVVAALNETNERAPVVDRAEHPASPGVRWNALREFYRAALPAIQASPTHVWAIDPYEIDWMQLFTPIERALWSDIRAEGAVLYPQYPVGRYFVDFGHPVAKVAIECDGASFHQDRARDDRRQREIEKMGWTVYRITGRDCNSVATETDDEQGITVEPSEAERLIRTVGMSHGLSARYARGDDDAC